MDIVHPPITTIPFVQRRVVQWGECDPTGIVYTPRFLDYALEAVDTWLGKFVGVDWYRLNTEHGLGMPIVHTRALSDHMDPFDGANRFFGKARRRAKSSPVPSSAP